MSLNKKKLYKSLRVIWLAAILGTFGALCRHGFGLALNGIRGYPVGTFCANIIGSLIYTVLYTVKGSLVLSDEGVGGPEVNPLPSVGDHALAIFFISAIGRV